MSAGIVFQNKTHVLMGYQPSKKMISGIGGKSLDGELTLETALRETVEELFGMPPTRWLLNGLLGYFQSRRAVQNGSYTMYIFSLHDLYDFMAIVRGFMLTSPYYPAFPETLIDLVLERRAPPDAEVTSLAIVPIVKDAFHLDTQDMPLL
jgi:8-oxo-dGTP pyrophosphatase MutT (NUDIX family)